jgi:hypothetical protein
MPLIKPKKDESHDDYMDRCMGDSVMNDEYEDEDQRYAVCQGEWDKHKKSENSISDSCIERRSFELDELKVEKRGESNTPHIVGHAAVFEKQSVPIWGFFVEIVKKGAFTKSIKTADVRALFNHDPNYVIARARGGKGTLSLKEDDVGLLFDAQPPDTTWARDLMVSIERGDISQCSFAFRVKSEKWVENSGKKKTDLDIRELHEVELFDVSPVTYPAYPDTDVGIRELRCLAACGLGKDLTSVLYRALRGETLENGDVEIVKQAIEALAHYLPQTAPAEAEILHRHLIQLERELEIEALSI